jgi:hypothetical protein
MNPSSPIDRVSVAKKVYQAYVDKDRALIESFIADNFHFTSPIDNRIDRANISRAAGPIVKALPTSHSPTAVQDDDRIFVIYEALERGGKGFATPNC